MPVPDDGPHQSAGTLAGAIRRATNRLTEAGVPSPRVDAELLAAHLLRLSPGELRAAAIRGAQEPEGYEELVAERARRVPLQHLTGEAAFAGLTLQVGPGAFVPRPETEQVALAARDFARELAADDAGTGVIIADLCTGSGAIAAALAHWLPGAEIHAVELSPLASAWAGRNLARTPVRLVSGDATAALTELDGRADVVVSNPPYVPAGAVPVDPEVAGHDPELALYGGGEDGLDLPRRLILAAARLLRPGGALVMEHGDEQGAAMRRALAAAGCFTEIETRPDLTGRDRMACARRLPNSRNRGNCD